MHGVTSSGKLAAAACSRCKQAGVSIMVDAILNHMVGYSEGCFARSPIQCKYYDFSADPLVSRLSWMDQALGGSRPCHWGC